MQVKDTASKNIGGVNYKVTLLSTSRAFITGQNLLKLGLPSLGAAADGVFYADEMWENQTWAAVAIHMVNQLNSIDTLEILRELLATLEADGIPVDYDMYFRGNFDVLVKVLEFVMKENYGSLFTGLSLTKKLAGFIKDYQTQQKQTAEEPKVETEQQS